MSIDLASEPQFRCGFLLAEPSRRVVRNHAGEERVLEPRVMQVLVVLTRAAGSVVSREELIRRCWDGRQLSDDAVERVIRRIRKLGEEFGEGGFAITTVPKVGYCLTVVAPKGEPEPVSPDPEPQIAPAPAAFWTRRRVVSGAVAAIGAIGITALALTRRDGAAAQSPSTGEPLTVAVLPFRSDAAVPGAEAVGRTLSDEVRASLSRIREIRVIAETSSTAAAAESGLSSTIGERLGADLLIEGQVGATADGWRVIPALIHAADQRQLWTEAFDGRRDDRETLRTAICGALVQQIAGLVPIASNPDEAPLRRPDPNAYDKVAEANRLLAQARAAGMNGSQDTTLDLGDRAAVLANEALAIDRDYSGAWLVLAVVARNGWTHALAAQPLSTRQRVEQSIGFVRRALLADPGDPAALTLLGDYYRRYEFRWDEAETLFRRALALNPSLADAHWSYAYQLGTTGRALEGLDHAIAVFELDPGNPFRRLALPRLLYLLGRRAEALRRYDIELTKQPASLFLLRELHLMFLSEGNADALVGLIGRLERQATTPEVGAIVDRMRAAVEALRGQPQRFRAMIDGDVAAEGSAAAASNATPQGRARDDLPYIYAIEYARAGAPERAIDMLERALTAKSLYWPATLPFGPAQFPPAVRDHPRFTALWQRDPGLRQLLVSRARALAGGQMAGFRGNGPAIAPRLSAALEARIRPLISRA